VRRPLALGLVLLAAAAAAPPAWAKDRLPPWAEGLRGLSPPSSFASADAVVLLHESSVVMERGDRFRETTRRLVRIVKSAGAREAVARAYYRTDGDKILSLDAWLVSPDGTVRKLAKKEAVDRAVLDEAIYNEARERLYSAVDDVRPGALFAYESVVDYRSPFAQFEWNFQEDIPTCRSRFRLQAFDGWSVATATVGRDSIPVNEEDGAWTWELRDVPGLEDEPLLPPVRAFAIRLAVNLLPPEGASTGSRRVIRRWEDASAWQAERVAALGPPGDRVRAKAAALAAGAANREDSIRAIARFTQSINYVSISMGLGRGGGYVPRPPGDVLQRSYGDCKDKANLMRSLLESIGIQAYLVGIRSRGGEFTLREFPALAQFDHCIVAVQSDTPTAMTVHSNAMGRLVLFDPTDPTTPWGSLPLGQQEAWGLLVAPHGGELVHVPASAPRDNARSRILEGTIGADGLLTARLRFETTGAGASRWRGTLRSHGAAEIERQRSWWMGPGSSAATVDSFGIREAEDGRILLMARFRMPRWGAPMAGNLLVMDTGRLGAIGLPALADTPRVHPIEIPADHYEETFVLRLPPGYALDDAPKPIAIESPFGTIRFEVREESGALRIERAMEQRWTVLPATEYDEVRRFYLEARRAFQAPLVLSRR